MLEDVLSVVTLNILHDIVKTQRGTEYITNIMASSAIQEKEVCSG